MKLRILSIIIACLMLFVGCNESEPQETSDSTDVAATSEQQTPSESTDSIGGDEGYLNIQGRANKRYKATLFSFKGSENVISVTMPSEWELTEKDGGYSVTRDGSNIGGISLGEVYGGSQWKIVKADRHTYNNVSVKCFIERNMDGEANEFRYIFVYSYDENGKTNTMTLDVKYEELDSFGFQKVFYSASTSSIMNYPESGQLAHLIRPGEQCDVLIMGNSFIGSSDIGAILKEMISLNDKPVSVSAITRGGATISTYVNDTAIMSQISQGEVDVVFICGFYDPREVDRLSELASACAMSNTQLVVFPAHNENSGVVSAACSANKSAMCLNWKAELDALISQCGVSRWDLCTDDYYDHSRPLAGYVGAQMIYRALFGESCTTPLSTSINQDEVNAILGDYAVTGAMVNIDQSKINYIK